MYPHPQYVKRNTVKTNVNDLDYRLFSAMAEFNGLSNAELARIFIQEGMKRRIQRQKQEQCDARAAG